MPIIGVSETMKIIDEKEMRKKKKAEKKKEVTQAIVKGWRVRAKWFCSGFKVGFLQLIYKASLISKLNLKLTLLIILKERDLCKSELVVVECRCLKIWDLLSVLICSSILVLKWCQVLPI